MDRKKLWKKQFEDELFQSLADLKRVSFRMHTLVDHNEWELQDISGTDLTEANLRRALRLLGDAADVWELVLNQLEEG